MTTAPQFLLDSGSVCGASAPLDQAGIQHKNYRNIVRLESLTKNDDPGVNLTYFAAISVLATLAFTLEKAKTMDILETVAA